MTRRWAILCGAAAFAAATAAGSEPLAARHFEQEKNGDQAQARIAAGASNAAITAIAIERSGPGCEYQAVIRADGTVEYSGVKGVDRLGDFAGTVDAARFQELADAAARIGYFALKTSYRARAADRPTVYTAVTAGAIEKIVMNYGDSGPAELKAFEQKIDDLLARAVWVKKESKERRP